MHRALVVVLLSFALAPSAYADVTIKQATSGKGMGMSGKTSGTTFIKGHKMRTDVVLGDKTQTTIFDVDAQKMYIFDSKKKEADVWDMAVFAQEMAKSVDVSSANASLKPNGQTRQIAGRAAVAKCKKRMVAIQQEWTRSYGITLPPVRFHNHSDKFRQFRQRGAEACSRLQRIGGRMRSLRA